jgi:hypothetical protein
LIYFSFLCYFSILHLFRVFFPRRFFFLFPYLELGSRICRWTKKKKKNNKKTRADRQPPETVSACSYVYLFSFMADWLCVIYTCFRPTSHCSNIVLGITHNCFLHCFLKYGLSLFLFRCFKTLRKWAVCRGIWEWKTWQSGVTPPFRVLICLIVYSLLIRVSPISFLMTYWYLACWYQLFFSSCLVSPTE